MEKQHLLAYVFSKAGNLHCFLRDLWALRREQFTGDTIFWLNEVPCTTVTFVGVVVGIKSYENNTCIWVDDGSAVVQTKLPHRRRVTHTVETSSKNATSDVQTETVMGPICELPVIGNTVTVFGSLEEAFRREQPVNIRIVDLLVCGNMEEVIHWTRVMELHKTKYSQPFVLPTNIRMQAVSTPQKTQQLLSDESTPKAPRHLPTPAPSVSPESVRSYVRENSSCNPTNGRIPRLRHPSRLKSSQLNLETFQTYVIYYMTCMMESVQHPKRHRDATPTRRNPFHISRRVANYDSSDEDEDLESTDPVGFGLGYLMRVPELQSLAIRVIKAERKLAEKRKILQERENLQRSGSLEPSGVSLRPKKQVRPGSLTKDTKRLFERVISNLFHNGAIIIEEGRSRTWDHHEAQLVNSLQLWKHKNGETQSQHGESTISELSTAAEDEIQLSDVDEREDAYVAVTPRLLHEPVLLVLRRATLNLRGQQARARGVPEKDILEQLKCMDARWDHVSSVATTLHQLEEEDEIWEVSQGRWVSHLRTS